MAIVEVWCSEGSTVGTAIPGQERLCEEVHPELGVPCTGRGDHLGPHLAVGVWSRRHGDGVERPKWPNRRGFQLQMP